MSLRLVRHNSTLSKVSLPAKRQIDPNSIYVISLPVTTARSYIFCHHRPSVLHSSQQHSYPWITRVESKVTSLASKGWNKMVNSKAKINVKIVYWVKKLLATIPYQESCLKSFPSKKEMIRVIKPSQTQIEAAEVPATANDETKGIPSVSGKGAEYHRQLPPNILQGSLSELNIPKDHLQAVPLYHPKFQEPCTILDQLYKFRDDAYKTHKKHAIMCALGIPLTLPMAVLPVVPNVPGFYLAYRLYCNIKALQGVKNLDYLLETDHPIDLSHPKKSVCEVLTDNDLVADTTHLEFKEIPNLDKIYALANDAEALSRPVQREEEVILTPDIIDILVERLEVPQLKEELLKAVAQEQKRLDKQLKTTDEVT
ncbi:hypothetical protein DIURU_000877 [Diutina rugosa]|uniref:Uncharacterized protein n=1 Tax=Diutina rugosa TaxID=5481 RepID=A0A642V226_DIURU|nr:uncharacterized protein DIURU_000877 [Diutina rugosa]KAA8907193.1 hypothetical protein DIURU_000877 [Diutina rugosa]